MLHWTGRTFTVRYNEHVQAPCNNNEKSVYFQHILKTVHSYGILENTSHILNTQHKGPYLNTLERYHINKIKKQTYY
jgi:hypothetical protein